ncbi:MAG: hypothetical protein O7C63_08645, partial [Alphaproteobacteria bacterium]|nr:hypothetical protein [Alphaproteobacteria bacterium]
MGRRRQRVGTSKTLSATILSFALAFVAAALAPEAGRAQVAVTSITPNVANPTATTVTGNIASDPT